MKNNRRAPVRQGEEKVRRRTHRARELVSRGGGEPFKEGVSFRENLGIRTRVLRKI